MRDVIANGPTASNKARASLSKEESARFFGPQQARRLQPFR